MSSSVFQTHTYGGMWVKMVPRVHLATGLGPLMEADAGSLTEHTSHALL